MKFTPKTILILVFSILGIIPLKSQNISSESLDSLFEKGLYPQLRELTNTMKTNSDKSIKIEGLLFNLRMDLNEKKYDLCWQIQKEIELYINKEDAYYGEYMLAKSRLYFENKQDFNKDSLFQSVMVDSVKYDDRILTEIVYSYGKCLSEDNREEEAKAYLIQAYYSQYAEDNILKKAKYANSLSLRYYRKDELEKKNELLEFAYKNGGVRTKVVVLANKSVVYAQKGELDTALVLINNAITLNETDFPRYPNLLATRANIYLVRGNYRKARQDFKQDILELREDDHLARAINHLNLGLTYYGEENYSSAIKSFERASSEAAFTQNNKLKQYILNKNAVANTKINSYAEAYRLSNEISLLKDSMYEKERIEMSTEMEAKYGVQEANLQNEKLEIEKELTLEKLDAQNKFVLGGSFVLVLISLLSLFLYNQFKKQRKLTQKVTTQKDQIEILNQEINHRVKNNLAFMTSLLEMQARRVDSPEAKQVLAESEGRLKALSIVHSNLFNNESDTEINLKLYLEEVLAHLQNIFYIPGKSLIINSNLFDLDFDAEDAMRIGLILNELVTNSAKHAFSDVQEPQIDIETSISNQGKVLLKYKDNGPGITTKQIGETKHNTSIGLRLIELLKKQLSKKLIVEFE
jgi:two-component sensor histidine kinase